MKTVIAPYMANNTLVGVFMGDEICCSNKACWDGQLAPVSAKLRALLGPKAILYTNECSGRYIMERTTERRRN